MFFLKIDYKSKIDYIEPKKKCFYIMQESESWFNEFFGKNWFLNNLLSWPVN